MKVHPRTPVIVGVGQVTVRPDDRAGVERPEPLDLMVTALEEAAANAGARGGALLHRLDSIRTVGSLVWHPPNAPGLVAERLGATPRQLIQSATGGTMPLSLLHDAASAIVGGDLDVAAIVGAECLHTYVTTRKRGEPRLVWTNQPDGATPATVFGQERAPATELELARGLQLPIQAYPLLENAVRAARGWTLEQHRQQIGRLWSEFSRVGANNPYAWSGQAHRPEEITTPSKANRMVAFPYPKLCTSNIQVDQAAGLLLCSVEAAQAAGVPPELWIFPWSGAEANDHWFLSDRPDLSSSPAIRLAGRQALALAGVEVNQLSRIDLYSCFPVVVEIAAQELGLPLGDPDRPLTITGGLTWAGGPGNNYASHSLATMVELLRAGSGDELGLVTGLGWYATKHAVSVLADRPPPGPAGEPGWRWASVQHEVDAMEKAVHRDDVAGPVTIETYTVLFDRQGAPERGLVVCRDASGTRGWGTMTELAELELLTKEEGVGRVAYLGADGTLRLC